MAFRWQAISDTPHQLKTKQKKTTSELSWTPSDLSKLSESPNAVTNANANGDTNATPKFYDGHLNTLLPSKQIRQPIDFIAYLMRLGVI